MALGAASGRGAPGPKLSPAIRPTPHRLVASLALHGDQQVICMPSGATGSAPAGARKPPTGTDAVRLVQPWDACMRYPLDREALPKTGISDGVKPVRNGRK